MFCHSFIYKACVYNVFVESEPPEGAAENSVGGLNYFAPRKENSNYSEFVWCLMKLFSTKKSKILFTKSKDVY